jgi:hypothetical protein
LSRLVDRGAVFAAWVGVGTAVVIVIAFALVVPIQAIVYLLAFPAGALIGWYANVRAERQRPRGRAVANAVWAGLITGLVMAVFYVGVRLLFIYADNGYPDYNRRDPATGQLIAPFCVAGPDCTYQRYLAQGRGPELERAGITNADAFARSIVSEQLAGGGILLGLTISGAAVAGLWRAVTPVRPQRELAPA